MEAERGGEKRAANDTMTDAHDTGKRQRRHDEAQQQQRELEEKKRQYFMTYGVAYGLLSRLLVDDLHFKTDPLDNESLLGKYNLVFYASQNKSIHDNEGDGENAELISRTARGIMELSLKEWDGKPAIFGTYDIDTRKSNGQEDNGDAPLGNYTSASFIETVASKRKKMFFKKHSISLPGSIWYIMGRKDFVVDRYPFSGVEWWRDLEGEGEREPASDSESDDSDSDFDIGDALCGGVIKIVQERHALPLWTHDLLRGNHYGKRQGRWESTTFDYANLYDVEYHEERMASYKDGSNSWICRHLQVPADVAFKIRQFVSPPPAFFVEEGDLMLAVKESKGSDWTKTLVFRKGE